VLENSAGPDRTAGALLAVLDEFLARRLPHRRLARLAGLLILANSAPPAGQLQRTARYLEECQGSDGGWVDCEDTVWCSLVVGKTRGRSALTIKRAISWLASERAEDAWGYCRRDAASIPLTSQVRLLVPELRNARSGEWLRRAWAADFESPVQLSYKAAWFLVARGNLPEDDALASKTAAFLLADQRASGAWGPWKTHPAPDDCFATGLAMWALATKVRGEKATRALRKAVAWCSANCLNNWLFPTHYIEEGSAWVLLGWKAALGRVR